MQELVPSLWDVAVIKAAWAFGSTQRRSEHAVKKACVLYFSFAKLS